jgi:hypothetical protein
VRPEAGLICPGSAATPPTSTPKPAWSAPRTGNGSATTGSLWRPDCNWTSTKCPA